MPDKSLNQPSRQPSGEKPIQEITSADETFHFYIVGNRTIVWEARRQAKGDESPEIMNTIGKLISANFGEDEKLNLLIDTTPMDEAGIQVRMEDISNAVTNVNAARKHETMERIGEIVIITNNSYLALMIKGLNSFSFGYLDAKSFPSVFDALEYLKSEGKE